MRATRAVIAVLSVVALAAPAVAEDLAFRLVNETGADLVGFHVSAGESQTWEENLLEGAYLAPGYEIEVIIADGATTCIYDIRGVFGDGEAVEDYGLDLCDTGSYTFSE